MPSLLLDAGNTNIKAVIKDGSSYSPIEKFGRKSFAAELRTAAVLSQSFSSIVVCSVLNEQDTKRLKVIKLEFDVIEQTSGRVSNTLHLSYCAAI